MSNLTNYWQVDLEQMDKITNNTKIIYNCEILNSNLNEGV
jgi:hypothetical protein